MEGGWRRGGLMPLALAGVLLSLTGACGDDGDRDDSTAAPPPPPGAIATDSPALTFAPILYLHPKERHFPVSGKTFVDHSTLFFAEAGDCQDDRVAGKQRLPRLAREPTYTVRPYAGSDCRRRSSRSYGAEELTRPRDSTPERASGLRPDEGFYLDLRDDERPGALPMRGADGQLELNGAAAWHQERRQQVSGQPGMRVTHWLLYGMHAPIGSGGRSLAAMTHEGDWERVDVLLQGSGRRWKPVALQLYDAGGGLRQVPWESLRRESALYDDRDGRKRVHPVVFGALGSHTLYAQPGNRLRDEAGPADQRVRTRDVTVPRCRACPRMETALPGFPLSSQTWYGFGGAWGEPGLTTLTTGPLGPRPSS